MLDNVFWLSLVIWPTVLIACAFVNFLISWVFSWQELVFCHLMGSITGLCFYLATVDPAAVPPPEVGDLPHFFLTASLGLFGLLKWLGVEALQDRATLFWVSSVSMFGATAVSAALDRVTYHGVGYDKRICCGLWSLIVVGFKAPFGLITTAVGALIGLIGLLVACGKSNGGFGFIGGILFTEFGYGSSSNYHATTFSSYVNIFKGGVDDVMTHELYHTRQYIYMQDWLGVFYFTVGALWGIISSAIHAAGTGTFKIGMAFDAENQVGNPIEIAPHKLDW